MYQVEWNKIYLPDILLIHFMQNDILIENIPNREEVSK